MIQPLMQGGLASTLVNYMIQDQDTLDLLKSQTKENHKPLSNNKNNHRNKPSASEDKTDTQSKKSNNTSSKSGKVCENCGKIGHKAKRCWSKKKNVHIVEQSTNNVVQGKEQA